MVASITEELSTGAVADAHTSKEVMIVSSHRRTTHNLQTSGFIRRRKDVF